MNIEMRCLYITKQNPIVSLETLGFFNLCDYDFDEETTKNDFMYPQDALQFIIKNGWIPKIVPTEAELKKDKLCYTFIKNQT